MILKKFLTHSCIVFGLTLCVVSMISQAQNEPFLYTHNTLENNLSAAFVDPFPDLSTCLDSSEDIILEADVPCIYIGSNIVVDLNGFTVNGPVYGGSNVTLKNGTVAAGIINLSTHAVIDRVTVRDSPVTFAVDIYSGTITHSVFKNNVVAVDLYVGGGSNLGGVEIRHSLFINNQFAINITWDDNSVIEHNVFKNNDKAISIWDEDDLGANGSIIRHNYFYKNNFGVAITAFVEARNTEITENTFIRNKSSGIAMGSNCFDFINSGGCGGDGTLIKNNLFLYNGNNPGSLYRYPNTIWDDGLTVVRTVLDEESGYDPANGITITGNVAAFNADLGIDAPNVIDGGNNFAIVNGNSMQCVGVECD